MKAGSVALVLIVNLFAVVACGATFYVSTSGSDGGSGSSDLPWLTIQHAVDNISPGDVIVVRAGTYAGARIENSGLASAHKTLRADTGASVILNAPGPNNKHTSILEVENFSATVRYWIIDGFEMTNAPRSGVDIRVTEFVTIQNCIVHDSGRTGLPIGGIHPCPMR